MHSFPICKFRLKIHMKTKFMFFSFIVLIVLPVIAGCSTSLRRQSAGVVKKSKNSIQPDSASSQSKNGSNYRQKIRTACQRKNIMRKDIVNDNSFAGKFKKQDQTSKELWKSYVPGIVVADKTVISFSHSLLPSVAQLTISKQFIKPEISCDVIKIQADINSSMSFFFQFNNQIESHYKVDEGRPLEYIQIERKKNLQVDDYQSFDHQDHKTYLSFYYNEDGKEEKVSTAGPIPQFFQDKISVFFFLQKLPLAIGDKYMVPVVSRGRLVYMKANVEGFESIKGLQKSKINAIRVRLNSKVPWLLFESKEVVVWFSSDTKRRILRINTEKFRGKLVAYEEY